LEHLCVCGERLSEISINKSYRYGLESIEI